MIDSRPLGSLRNPCAASGGPSTARARRELRPLLRFVAAGSAGNVVYSLVFLALAQTDDDVTLPSTIASIASTLAVNEAHRLWTFRGVGRPSVLAAHISGAASAVVGTGLTAAVLLAWTWISPDASLASDVVLSWAVTALVGALNFLHLRRASTATTALDTGDLVDPRVVTATAVGAGRIDVPV